MKNTNEVAKQNIMIVEQGKNVLLTSLKVMKNGKRREDKVTVSAKNLADLRAKAKKDPNAFNDAVTAIAGAVNLDSKAEKAGLCKHARTKTLQARFARLLGVETSVAKTNGYLREAKKAKKATKKAATKKA